MNGSNKSAPSEKGQRQLEALRKAVAQTLERKKRLGQYAVVWKNGKPVVIGEDAPEESLDSA
jgi:hypothetical protein